MTALSASREAGTVDEANFAVALPIIHLTARKSSGEPLTWPADLSMTRSMKHSTSCSQRESSKPPFEVRVSSLRRTVRAAAYLRMISSDRLSTLLCHDVDTVAAFARDRFAYSPARSLSRFRPVVRTGSILPGWARFRRENPYAIGICDRPATVSQALRSLACIVKWSSKNSASSIQFGCQQHGQRLQFEVFVRNRRSLFNLLPALLLRGPRRCGGRTERVVIHFIRDARHRPNEECGHTAIPQCAIGALFAGNPSQCGGREFDV